MKAQVKNYLSLTKKEWNGVLVLIVLIILVLAAPYVYQWFHKDSTINFNEFNAAFTQLSKANKNKPDISTSTSDDDLLKRKLFQFNPNGLPAEQWKMLGLADKQIAIIKHYEAKGGKFYKPQDLKKIYGITDAQYKALAPYINIPASTPRVAGIIELNSADSASLTTVEGIGPGFAKRILYYRERLGGFINKEQLKEIYGLDEVKYNEVKAQVKVDASKIRRIDINTISFDKLRPMPYLNYKQVNAIIEYRTQHGKYASISDLRNIAIIDEGILRKIEPYLLFK